ncbi:MAG: uL30 family ribosomal protein [Candidatus Marsarchaeota archaeon]|jgi:large subunit ribosomal protein L30|nr:uL30 family ribosomal protein [Candidatus Marsarchaeota archaeon]MCL5115208.1 uL30 family ribosomal protein [Candidatus Marsarchaeota archaeon]
MEDKMKNRLIAAIRVRGRVNVRYDINETLDRLRLRRVNNCTLVKLTDSYYGMIKQCSSYIAYGEPNEETLKRLVEKGELGIKPEELMEGKYDYKELKKKLPIRLHPPRHGYRSIKRSVKQGGSLGYMGEGINNLIQRMVK